VRNEPEQEAMSVEYLLVSFPEDRDVLADGDRVGVTNHTILITANEYTITATTQNNLGTALSTLGERESGTARLEQAVAAYRDALQERTRESGPLQWAMTQSNLGLALSTLG
jgi:hypothetical protein